MAKQDAASPARTGARASPEKAPVGSVLDGPVQAKVTSIASGQYGPYAVAMAADFKGSITFFLGEDVWPEKRHPNVGETVVLSELHKKTSGWRAMLGRFFLPSDE